MTTEYINYKDDFINYSNNFVDNCKEREICLFIKDI